MGQVGSASLVQTTLYVGVNQNVTYRAYGIDLAPFNLWTAMGAGAMGDMILAPPIVNSGLVFGVADANDGLLRAFQATDGAPAFSYNPTNPAKSALSAVGISSAVPPVYYFSDGSGELNAAVQSGTAGALAPNWGSSFKGKSALGTDLSFASYGTEPVIGPDGTLYFAANNPANTNANVYAIMTDTGARGRAGADQLAAGGIRQLQFEQQLTDQLPMKDTAPRRHLPTDRLASRRRSASSARRGM
jgi:hypothetical protein